MGGTPHATLTLHARFFSPNMHFIFIIQPFSRMLIILNTYCVASKGSHPGTEDKKDTLSYMAWGLEDLCHPSDPYQTAPYF